MIDRIRDFLGRSQDPDILEKELRNQNASTYSKKLFELCDQYAAGQNEWAWPEEEGPKFLSAKKTGNTWFIKRLYLEGDPGFDWLYVFAVNENSDSLRVGSAFVDDKIVEANYDVRNLIPPELTDFKNSEDFFTLIYANAVIKQLKSLISEQKAK